MATRNRKPQAVRINNTRAYRIGVHTADVASFTADMLKHFGIGVARGLVSPFVGLALLGKGVIYGARATGRATKNFVEGVRA